MHTTARQHLAPCVSFLRDYLRKTDRNGLAVFNDYVDDLHTEADCDASGLMELLTDCLRTRFTVDVLDCPTAVNLEDRENAFAVLERAECFGPEAFAGEFLRLAPYFLHNIDSEAL